MKNYIKPRALKRGDTIAIVSPSSDIVRFSERTQRAIGFLEKKGYKVKMMPNALATDGYSGGAAERRAADIHDAFLDSEVSAIVCSTGGLTANAVLPLLDYELIRRNPKIFCGYSDVTTLLLMITSKSELVTFHGPTLLPSFGEFEGAILFTFEHFENIVSGQAGCGDAFPLSRMYTIDNQYWGRDDTKNLIMQESPEMKSFGPKMETKGLLFGGNLQTFSMLMHEDGFFDVTGAILFLEEEGLSTDWYERYLIELERKGIFDKINGLIFAKPSGSFEEMNEKKRSLESIFLEISKKYDIPILTNVDCGHTKPILTFPLGVVVKLDTRSRTISLGERAVN